MYTLQPTVRVAPAVAASTEPPAVKDVTVEKSACVQWVILSPNANVCIFYCYRSLTDNKHKTRVFHVIVMVVVMIVVVMVVVKMVVVVVGEMVMAIGNIN